MNSFHGETLSWDQKDGIIELALHRPPANEIGPATLAELQNFVATFESASPDASAECNLQRSVGGVGFRRFSAPLNGRLESRLLVMIE
jgi:hypothetical protein